MYAKVRKILKKVEKTKKKPTDCLVSVVVAWSLKCVVAVAVAVAVENVQVDVE